MNVWRLIGARQAKYGIGPLPDTTFLTLVATFDVAGLSAEAGHGVEVVETIPESLTDAELFDVLAKWEGWDETWAEQKARTDALDAADGIVHRPADVAWASSQPTWAQRLAVK